MKLNYGAKRHPYSMFNVGRSMFDVQYARFSRLRLGRYSEMKDVRHQISKTIFYGIVSGVSVVPISVMLNAFIPWSRAVCLTLLLFIAGYAFLLSHWGNQGFRSTVLPLLVLVPTFYFSDSMALLFFQALIVISWIRSGICYQNTGARGLAVEFLLCFFGAVLVHVFSPGSVSAWALGVWMFFLVQALYFVFFEHTGRRPEEPARMDAFEWASRQADRILADTHFYS